MKPQLDEEIAFLNSEIGNPDTVYQRGHLFAARDALLFAKGEKGMRWWRE